MPRYLTQREHTNALKRLGWPEKAIPAQWSTLATSTPHQQFMRFIEREKRRFLARKPLSGNDLHNL